MSEVSADNVTLTRVASGDLPQYRFVRQSATKDVYLASSGVPILGVSYGSNVRDNDHATVILDGVTKICLSQSLGASVEVISDANGFAQRAVALANSGSVVGSGTIAGFLISSANSGSIAEMIIARR